MPEQAKVPKYLGKCEVLKVHDDGDLTVKCKGKKHVVTTEGEVFKEIKREPVGTCFEDAFRFLLKEQEGDLVHGTIESFGKRIEYAWVVLPTGYIWEPSNKIFVTKEQFEVAKPIEKSRYDLGEAAKSAVKTSHYGPW